MPVINITEVRPGMHRFVPRADPVVEVVKTAIGVSLPSLTRSSTTSKTRKYRKWRPKVSQVLRPIKLRKHNTSIQPLAVDTEAAPAASTTSVGVVSVRRPSEKTIIESSMVSTIRPSEVGIENAARNNRKINGLVERLGFESDARKETEKVIESLKQKQKHLLEALGSESRQDILHQMQLIKTDDSSVLSLNDKITSSSIAEQQIAPPLPYYSFGSGSEPKQGRKQFCHYRRQKNSVILPSS